MEQSIEILAFTVPDKNPVFVAVQPIESIASRCIDALLAEGVEYMPSNIVVRMSEATKDSMLARNLLDVQPHITAYMGMKVEAG